MVYFENTLLLFLCSLYVLQEEIWDCILDVIVKAGFLTLSESIAVFFPLRFASYCCSNENWNRWRLPLLLLRVSIKKPFKCIIASFFANQFTYNVAAFLPLWKILQNKDGISRVNEIWNILITKNLKHDFLSEQLI